MAKKGFQVGSSPACSQVPPLAQSEAFSRRDELVSATGDPG